MVVHARRTLIGVLAAIAALLFSVALHTGSATAAPERGFTDESTAVLPEVKDGRASLDATYSCSRSVPIPAYFVDIDCSVYSGAIRVVVTCSDGYWFASPIIFAGYRFTGRGTCGPPWTVRTTDVETVF
ncbi:hypothetical protein FE391_13095 [Nonomuraea sp. KC401]|uniref:hypothetical protein n=1 Tax=unclassified Nonomuraea TaxID=2593643 RepID=UPI0010FD2BAF|nr:MULTISPECIES: hypothetical protein [unclassified Nonomuraea]NBE91889.1 hypothetical protein [Nonomuraea sp. K271]TLF75529.1 hypothetical protein FE391_13095 [Nonomuraea sp. KC401]